MKFLKSGSLFDYGAGNKNFTMNPHGRISTNSTNSLKVPVGTTAQRPEVGVASNGVIRYNSTLDILEGYVSGGWEVIKRAADSTITKQTIVGYTGETYHGPLTIEPATFDNMLVLVDNVLQIYTANFTTVTNPGGTSPSRNGIPYPTGTYLRFPDGLGGFESVPTGINVTIYYGFDI